MKKINSGKEREGFPDDEMKNLFLEKREKERVEREQRRDDDIKRRNQAQMEENMQRMKVFEESAKSFGTKLETQVDRMRDQALKDKQAYIEKERKAYEISLI